MVEEEAIELLTGKGSDTAQLHVGSERSHAGLLVKRDVTQARGVVDGDLHDRVRLGEGAQDDADAIGEIGLLHAEVGV